MEVALSLLLPFNLAHGTVPTQSGWEFLPQFTQSRDSLTDVPNTLYPRQF